MTSREQVGRVAVRTGGFLLLWVVLASVEGLRNPFYGTLSGGVGEGTPYYTTWNAIVLLLGLLLAGGGWWLARRKGEPSR